jgi:hypothetical protein
VTGKLAVPVNNLQAARDFLRNAEGMEENIYPEYLQPQVHTARWDLTDDDSWEVILVSHRPLTAVECELLSSWISGQNSDGLGEGFEQQSFAEHGQDDRGEEFLMSSFDWETNPCALELVK